MRTDAEYRAETHLFWHVSDTRNHGLFGDVAVRNGSTDAALVVAVDGALRYLKAELKRAEVTYETLANRLNEKGWNETKAGITNKLARGAFTATFFFAALAEIGCQTVRLEDL